MLLMGVSLQISDYEILKDAGKISHEIAQEKALDEYEKFRLIQDRDFLSDFDKEIKGLFDRLFLYYQYR